MLSLFYYKYKILNHKFISKRKKMPSPTYEELKKRVKDLEQEQFIINNKNSVLMQQALDSIQDGVVILDSDLNIVYANKMMQKWYTSKAPLEGNKCYKIFENRSTPCENCPSLTALTAGIPATKQKTLSDNDKIIKNISLSSFPLRSESGEIYGVVEYIRDITDESIMELALKEKQEHLYGVIDAITDHMSMVDENHNIIWVNKVAVEYFGPDIIGKKCFEVYQNHSEPCEQCVVRKTFNDGKVHHRESETTDINGKKITFWITSSVAERKEDGSPKFVIEISRNISERKEFEKKLRDEKINADKANRAKSEFLANMSHEIRTPMNAIIGMSKLALDSTQEKKTKDLLSSVHAASNNLLNLLNDILDFSKIEAGELHIENNLFSFPNFLDNLYNIMKGIAEEKGLILKIEPDKNNLPEIISADELRLNQILINLINNAIKFTDKGSVIVKIKSDKYDSTSKQIDLKFKIIDTGIGIRQDTQKEIFDNFKQVDSSSVRKYGGTGLGLAICKQLVEIMGGQIWLESEPGKGSIFQFNIIAGQAKKILSSVSESKSFEPKNLNILVVEDNQFNRDLSQMVLEQENHIVDLAVNGLNSLEVIADKNFDMVLMDIQMPVMDGYTASRIIRSCEQGKSIEEDLPEDLLASLAERLKGNHLPIIAMTANAMVGDKEKSFLAGMDDYLTKPFRPEQLEKVIQKLINNR
jgi:PAS domain S-box-containing protein